MSNNLFASIIIPVMNEAENVLPLAQELIHELDDISYEIIFIDDGSEDETLYKISEVSSKCEGIKSISFSRNFGQQAALKAGLDHASGDFVIMMDGDREHPTSLIQEMIEGWKMGYDIVSTQRDQQGSKSIFKKISSSLFYRIMNFLSDTKVTKRGADFRLLDKKVVEVLKQFPEQPLFWRGLVNWLGFKQKLLIYSPNDRVFGHSKYSKKRMFDFSIDGITSFSVKPLRISSILGFTLSALAMIYGLYAIYIHLYTDKSVTGWTSLIVLIAFIGGIQMIMIGVLGEYIGKLFIASKNRPHYIVKEKSGFKE